MKNNTKKGFTLVELLVVIAILAILATVSVVGYTSFIERANVSNDENIAAQLNQFLTALKADSSSPFYGDEVNEDNIWQITDYILEDCGLEELKPQSGNYGYHFYYNFASDKYEVVHDDVALGEQSPFSTLMRAFAEEGDKVYAERLGNFFTVNHQYFLVDTQGKVAELINKIYSFNGDIAGLANLYAEAQALTNSKGEAITAVATLMEKIVFVTDNGTFALDVTADHNLVIISNELGKNSSTVAVGSLMTGISGELYIDDTHPLFTATSDTIIKLPQNAVLYGGSLNIDVEDGVKVVVDLGKNSWENCDAGFTNNNVIIKRNGSLYELYNGSEVYTYVEGGNGNEGTFVTSLACKNAMEKVDVKIEDFGDSKKLHTITSNNFTNLGYIAWNQSSFKLMVGNSQGTNANAPVSSTAVTWTVLENIDGLISVDKTTGEVTISDSVKLAQSSDSDFVIRATATTPYAEGEYATRDFTIKVVKLDTVQVGLSGDYEPAWSTSNTVTLLFDGGDGKEYSVSVKGVEYINKIAEIELDLNVNVAFASDHDCANNEECCLHYQGTHIDFTETNTCLACIHEKDGHIGSDGDCKHGSTDIFVSEDTSGFSKGTYYRCPTCPKTNDPNHWCYKVGKSTGWVTDKGDCGGACQKNTSSMKAPVAHVHDANCCNHTHTDQTECLECLHIVNNLAHTDDCANCTHIAPECTGNKLVTKGACTSSDNGTITVTVDHLTWGTVDAMIIDTSKLPIVPNSAFGDSNNIYVGNNSPITFADLFQLRDGSSIGSNYVLKIFDNVAGTVDYMYADGRTPLATSGSFNVNTNEINLSTAIGTEIDFTGISDNAPITMAVYEYNPSTGKYLRMSEDITVNVVNGTNIRTYADLMDLVDTEYKNDKGELTNPVKDSIVLLGDIAMTSDINYFSMTNKVLYGNLFTFNIVEGRRTDGVITIVGSTLQDVKIIGQVYTSVALRVTDDQGSPAVRASGNSVIDNCYIANCRAPLRIDGNTTVRDSVLFGGRYCNIDLISGTLLLEGKVVTVQQTVVENGTNVIGLGISTWFNNTAKTIKFAKDADLVQYNFVSQNSAKDLPAVKYSVLTLLETKSLFNSIFGDTDTFGDFIFTASDNTKYVNSGIVVLDKHNVSITYTPVGDDGKHKVGDTITITLMPTGNDSAADITLYYDNSKYNESTTEYDGTANDGKIVLEDLNLVAGQNVVYTLTVVKEVDVLGHVFDIDYAGEALNQLKIVDANGKPLTLTNYGQITYNYEFPSLFGSVVGNVSDAFHGSGIHYDRMEFGAYTMPYTDVDNQALLEEYLALGNSYKPDSFVMSYDK